MTAQQIRLVRETMPSLTECALPLSQLFYGRLFQTMPGLRPMFRNDIRVQGRKFIDMLMALIDRLDNLEQTLPVLRQRHVAYGVLPEHYAPVCAALEWTLAQGLQAEFTGATRAAWSQMLAEVGGVMQAGAAELQG